jgi:hypothetical protein
VSGAYFKIHFFAFEREFAIDHAGVQVDDGK